MAILWCGGEDVDFPNGFTPGVQTSTSLQQYRSGWARCGLCGGGGTSSICKSTLFPGGETASGWLRFYIMNNGTPSSAAFLAGLAKYSPSAVNAIGVGLNANTQTAAIVKVVNGTVTVLANSSTVLNGNYMYSRVDLQLVNYGTSSVINLYVNGALVVSFNGDSSISGITGFDCVEFGGWNGSNSTWFSEFIVANESTLAFQGLATLAPNGNGASQQWSNPGYTNINPAVINDANAAYSNTPGQDEQVTLNNSPVGSYQIKAVKVIARAAASSGAAATSLKLGFNNTGNSTVAEGAAHVLSSGFSSIEDYFAADPTNGGAAWGANLNGYQLELKSE